MPLPLAASGDVPTKDALRLLVGCVGGASFAFLAANVLALACGKPFDLPEPPVAVARALKRLTGTCWLASPRRQQQKQRRSSLLQAHDFPPFSRFALDARAAGLPTAYAPPLPPHLVDQRVLFERQPPPGEEEGHPALRIFTYHVLLYPGFCRLVEGCKTVVVCQTGPCRSYP